MENSLLASGGVTRRRLDVVRMRWNDDELRMAAERRLAAFFGADTFTLSELGHAETLLGLLRDYGGQRPLGWLQTLRPFVDEYARQAQGIPLSAQQCLAVWRNHPPRLHVDVRRQQASLGFRLLDVESGGFRLLRYLYENSHRTCPYDELYYVAWRGYDHVVRSVEDKYYELPAAWKHTFEMALSRLRDSIEVDPRNPPYIITVRQRGVRLENLT